MSLRFAFTNKPFFPLYICNLRQHFRKKKRVKKGRGRKSSSGTTEDGTKGLLPRSRTWEGGPSPMFRRVPKWPAAHNRNKMNKKFMLDPLNLSKLRYFIEKGRLDTRFPITQRHLVDSRCVKSVKNGIGLFNVNDFPFPYKIDIEVAGADQSSIDMIKSVGGSVTIVYMERVALRAHIKPRKYEVLPRTPRPTLRMVHYLERQRARGAQVRYIKPLWLIEEERRLQTQLRELRGEDGNLVAERLARENEPRHA